MNTAERYLAVSALGIAAVVAIYELAWVMRSRVAWILVLISVAVCCLALAHLVKSK